MRRAAWILRGGDVLAAAEIAEGFVDRSRGVAGREVEGALLLLGSRSAHTFGAPSPIDVALLDRELVVLDVLRVPAYRVVLPRRRCRSVLQARAGSFERWGLRPGDCLEVRETS